MIPADLAAFRALMRRACETAYYSSCDVLAEEGERVRDKLDSDALDALATATPAQLCGIAGTVQVLDAVPHGVRFTITDGDILVTPREGA